MREIREALPALAVGEHFSPWRRFNGYMIPDPVMASSLSLGAKVCYAVLARFHGRGGLCVPTMRTIGKRIGVSDRQAKNYVGELERGRFIIHARRGRGRSNRYVFLWHESFETVEGIDSSRERGSSVPTKENPPKENTIDKDYLTTHRKDRDAHSDLAAVARSIDTFEPLALMVTSLVGKQASQSSLGRIVSATPGKTIAQAVEAIQQAVDRGYGEQSKNGPRSFSWFVSVVQNYWQDWEQRALPPAAKDSALDAADFELMTDAIEVPM